MRNIDIFDMKGFLEEDVSEVCNVAQNIAEGILNRFQLLDPIGIGSKGSRTYELDDVTLSEIAKATGGQYFQASDRVRLEVTGPPDEST